jgi:hypothetical protein
LLFAAVRLACAAAATALSRVVEPSERESSCAAGLFLAGGIVSFLLTFPGFGGFLLRDITLRIQMD